MGDDIKKWTDDEIVGLLHGDMEKAKSIQGELATQREEYYKLFRMAPYGNEREGFAQTVAPTVFCNHKWSMANLMEIFNEEFFLLKGEDEERAAKFQRLIYTQMFNQQDGFAKFYDFLFNANLYHYSVFKVYYKEEFDLENEKFERLAVEELARLAQDENVTVTKYDEVELEDGGFEYQNVKIVRKVMNFAGPHFEVVPNWEFYYSPDCKINDWGGIEGRLVCHVVRRTLNDVRKREKAGIYRPGTFEKVRDLLDTVSPDSPDKTEILFNADSISETDTKEPSNLEDNILGRQVEIKECYFNLDIDGDGLQEPVIIDVVNDQVVCRIVENPYKRPCFRIGRISPEPHKVTGIANPAILDNDQKIATNLLRLIQDSAAFDCYKNPVTSDHNMFVMLQSRKPYAAIKGDPSKLGEVKTSPPSQFVLKAYELIKSENEEKTGITRYNQGMDARSLNKTATGIDAIMSASAKPMRLVARLLGNGAIKGLIRDFIFINQKWPPHNTMRLLGTKITVNPEDLDGQHEIEIDIGVSIAEKNAMANQLDLFIQFATQAGIRMGIMSPAHVQRAQRKKYKLLGIKIDEMMFSEDEMRENAEMAKRAPKEPTDLRQYVQLDKLFPYLTPMEQAQILQHFEIQPDPRRGNMPAEAMSGERPADAVKLMQGLASARQPQPPVSVSPAQSPMFGQMGRPMIGGIRR